MSGGWDLFANDSVLDFYPKFGFRKETEYQYSKKVSVEQEATVEQIPMYTKEQWKRLEDAALHNQFQSAFDMTKNIELYMFYVTKFMQENVYYDRDSDVYAIAEIENDELMIHAVFSNKNVTLEQVIQTFGKKIKKVTLGFAPANPDG